jgi:hypothetical protein
VSAALRRRPAAVVCAFLAATLLVCSRAPAAAATQPAVCSVITKRDIFRILGWTVDHVRKRTYNFGTTTGKMCNYESSEGIVTTIMPDPGSAFPGLSSDNTPDSGNLVETLPGLGAQVQLFNGSVFVTRDRRRVSVRVVPESHPASYADVEPFAKVIVGRFR